jgi:hypothetical protein
VATTITAIAITATTIPATTITIDTKASTVGSLARCDA